jgi:hypothetical protein
MKFEVNVPELHWCTYEITAASVAEARKLRPEEILANDDTGAVFSRTFDPGEVPWELCDSKGNLLNLIDNVACKEG